MLDCWFCLSGDYWFIIGLYVNALKICCASEVFEEVQIASLSHLLIFVYSRLIFNVHTLNCCNQSFISLFLFLFYSFQVLVSLDDHSCPHEVDLVFRMDLNNIKCAILLL